MLPFARHAAPEDAVLIAPGGDISAAHFLAQALALSAALPDGGQVINLCDSRHGFMLGYAAALLRGATSLFPPGKGQREVTLLAQAHPAAVLLVDGDEAFAPSARRVDVRPCLGVAAPAAGTWPAQARQLKRIDDHQLAVMLFTSGTTGEPSACLKTWGQLCRGAAGLGQALGWEDRPGVSIIGSVPPQHMFGLEATVMLPWCLGLPVHAHTPMLPADLVAALASEPAGAAARRYWWMTTPLHLRTALPKATPGTPAATPGTPVATPATPAATPGALAGVLASTMNLAVPAAQAAETAWGVPVLEIYGSTETGAVAIRRTASETLWRPLPDVLLQPAPHEASAEPSEEPRRVQVSGGHIAPPVLLGDALRLLPDGRFEWLGRSGDLIKIGGKRASLAALNRQLCDLPGVEDGVCFFPEDDGDAAVEGHTPRRLAALYASDSLTPQQLTAALRAVVDPVFLPRPLFRVPRLPRNANGKLPAAELARLYASCRTPARRHSAAAGGKAVRIELGAIAADHPALPGHFPGAPIVPGAVLLARVAQALERHWPDFHAGELLDARFHAPVQPDRPLQLLSQAGKDRLRFELRLTAGPGEPGLLLVSGAWALDAAGTASA